MAFADIPPKLNDTKFASELGRKGTYRYRWTACTDCGKTRWVPVLHGEPAKQRCLSCANRLKQIDKTRDKNPNWKGGRRIDEKGYVVISLDKNNPFFNMCGKGGRTSEHRLVMAEHLGRDLETWEIVHHLNGDRADNRIENLELLPNASYHCALTKIQQYIKILEERVKDLSGRLSKYEEVD